MEGIDMESKVAESSLENWAKNIQKFLISAYSESSSILDHDATIGAIRETVITNILKKFLPPSLQMHSGQIMAYNEKKSRQLDIIIAKENAPAYHFPGNVSVFFLETVLATIEVKSILYKEKLIEALDNCKSVKNLPFSISIASKGKKIFDEVFEWTKSVGGLEAIDNAYLNPCEDNALGCPEELWNLLYFVFLWEHWARGDFNDSITMQRLEKKLITPECDLFLDLLSSYLGMPIEEALTSKGYSKADEIKKAFFELLYGYVAMDNLPPDTIIFAYGGYKNIQNMIGEVKNWYQNNLGNIDWYMLPRIILNHKMFMYRKYNNYYCNEYEAPVLFLVNALISKLFWNDQHYRVSYGIETGISEYYNLEEVLKGRHPKDSPSYKTWTIPLNSKSAGVISPLTKRNRHSKK
jgi:hypothetical protein